jgi:metal-responsive CopG/Arc/MetJ family transcriptional regulator
MAEEIMRTHVVVPKKLLLAIDQLVGRRSRSKFFADAAAEKLARVRLDAAARQAAGSLADVDIPGWETSEAAAEWVRASRQVDDARSHRAQEDE